MKPINFGAGPAALPEPVITGLRQSLTVFANTGFSLIELSHRSGHIQEMIADTTLRLRTLLNISDSYEVLWLPGGASLQFAMIPMNFLTRRAAYVNSGYWSQKAITEALRFGPVDIVASSEAHSFTAIPQNVHCNASHNYLHITSNNTIYGTQFNVYPEITDGFLVADMSSDICSRTIDINQFGIIYAGAQKNLGPAGVCLGIIRNDLVKEVKKDIPFMLNYQVHADKKSCYNTPPVYAIYGVNLLLQWLLEQGGIPVVEKNNRKKARKLYAEIDRNSCFYAVAEKADRSIMNVVFRCHDERLESSFLNLCVEHGLHALKGHRAVGGLRASLYNAIDVSAVERLVACMREFEALNQ
ncbi:MAG: 3-phosphoserine/phosphohydroxythreonine transaminase [Fidelibacterota bacterium]